MARLKTNVRYGVTVAVATLLATAPTLAVDQAIAADPAPGSSIVEFYTPRGGETERVDGTVHLVLGAASGVDSVVLSYRKDGGGPVTFASVMPDPTTHVVDYTWTNAPLGTVDLQATGLDADDAILGTAEADGVTLSTRAGTQFTFVRPAPSGEALGVFRRADGHSFARASGFTTRVEEPTADAPDIGAVAPPASALPAPTGTFRKEADRWTYRQPVDLSGNPGLATRRAVIRVHDSVSSSAVETPLYIQTIGTVTSTTTPVPGTSKVTITARVTDQKGQVVVGAPVRLRGYINGSKSPVSQLAVTDAHDGLVTFTNGGAGFPAGFYVAYVDVNLNGKQAGRQEIGSQSVVGTVSYAAPGRPLYHNNVPTRRASGTVGDSLLGTRLAAARRYQWIDQDGHLSFATRAVRRGGAARVTAPAHLTWVNAHGAPFNPRWLKNGRFETRAWSAIQRRPGLRNADMTFKQNAAHNLSVEWEVKDIRPFTSTAALNAAFASLAASAQRYYGPAWASRVEIKMLSNLSGGLPFALRVLRYAHAQGFTTMLLARGAAASTQIPASAHQYVTYVRGARAGLYATR
jgi:hypothetical protein